MAGYVDIKSFANRLEAIATAGFDTDDVHAYLNDTLIEPSSLDTFASAYGWITTRCSENPRERLPERFA